MLRPAVLISILFILTGCQQQLVQRRVNQMAGTFPSLYYEQVLNNLALSITNPNALPYFGSPNQATHTNVRQLQSSYMPGWDFISVTSLFTGRYLFDKQMATLQGQFQNQEAIQLSPLNDPDKLLLMQALYRSVWNDPTLDPRYRSYLQEFFTSRKKRINYYDELFRPISLPSIDTSPNDLVPVPQPARPTAFFDEVIPWLSVGSAASDKHQPPACAAEWLHVEKHRFHVPKNACYTGRYCGTHVWVSADGIRDLTLLTLAVLDINSATATGAREEFLDYRTPNLPVPTPPPASQ